MIAVQYSGYPSELFEKAYFAVLKVGYRVLYLGQYHPKKQYIIISFKYIGLYCSHCLYEVYLSIVYWMLKVMHGVDSAIY